MSHAKRSFGLAAALVVGMLAIVWWRRAAEPRGTTSVWAIDDGLRVGSRAGALAEAAHNRVWTPDGGIASFGLRGETLALQIVVSAGALPRREVRLDIEGLDELEVETFVVTELPLSRRSGGEDPRESLGWSRDSTPAAPPGGLVPDPLLPITVAEEVAPVGYGYPLSVPPHEHRVLWLDVTIPEETTPGEHHGRFVVTSEGAPLSVVPITLEVGSATLPFQALRTMVYVNPEAVVERMGAAALAPTLQLIHRHHLTPFLPITRAEDLDEPVVRAAITGELYTEAHGYRGPGRGVPADLVVIGSYGQLHEPEPRRLGQVGRLLERLDRLAPKAQRFLYAVDEQCDSPLGPAWREALDASPDPRLRALMVGHTCSRPPAEQPVDLVMVFAPSFRLDTARATDKPVFIYNGALPRTGTFLSDGPFLSLRANAWIQAHHRIERWFYWESVFWNDDNRGGLGPYDPWATAETFHNADGDHCNGDGVLLYPGRQHGGRLDLGQARSFPSLRLAQWRRGIQDAAYLKLVETRSPALARQISGALVGDAFDAQHTPSFPLAGDPWYRARRALFEALR
ncbi:MAG: DUF4091 domain-containing protein [Myxococcales bacterium]|nr:DUF4091 domain-containing protein [Myxococcales bacterium]